MGRLLAAWPRLHFSFADADKAEAAVAAPALSQAWAFEVTQRM
jgi:hypothetical protein